MTKILFVCHGNICRSPMAEYFMKELVRREGLEKMFEIASAATSSEEIGNDVYPPARKKLAEHNVLCPRRAARRLTRADFDEYDLVIGMDSENLRNMRRICGGDPAGKLSLLLDWTNRPMGRGAGEQPQSGLCGDEVADPWYTGDFDATWRDVDAGCRALLAALTGPNPEKSDIL